jgi:hypothetical protein
VFAKAHPDAHRNVDDDPNIPDALREELTEKLLTAPLGSRSGIQDAVEVFCWSRQRQGPPASLAQTSHLGHVRPRERLEELLASARSPKSGLSLRKHRPFPVVDQIVRSDLSVQKDLLRHLPLAPYQMWSIFQPSSPDNALKGVSTHRRELRRRLGLGHVTEDEELLWWTHRLHAHQEAHVPTAFDAGLNPFFRPGGKTHPLDHASDGLPEVVHPAVTGAQLTHRIEQAG